MTALDAPEIWPQIGRGGQLRNAKGEALIKIDGRNRIAIGGSALDPFEQPYYGDPIHGERGQHCHDIAELADRGLPLADDVLARGVELDLTVALQSYIYARWVVFLKEHGFTVVVDHIEQTVANKTHLVASNIDRIFERDGAWYVGDIKTARSIEKRSYLLQLAMYAHPQTVPYNPQTGVYSEWATPIDSTVGYILHFPAAAAIEAGDDRTSWPDWQCRPVELAVGHDHWNEICRVRDTDVSHAFTIAAPTTSVVVQPPDGDDERTANAVSSPSTLEQWRAAYETWNDLKREAFNQWRYQNGITSDATETERVAAYTNFHSDYTFADISSTPQPRPVTADAVAQEQPDMPDEGPELPPADFTALSNIYRDYPKPARDWIATLAKDAQHGHVSFHTKNNRTARRFHLMRALINICEHSDRDRILDVELRSMYGDIMVDHNPPGLLVGCCDHHQAATLADRLTEQATP